MSSKRNALSVLAVLLLTAVFGYASALDQPYIQRARTNLQVAKAELLAAEHNKGGHRTKALEYVNAAIAEVNQGIRFDRRHNHAQATDVFVGPRTARSATYARRA